MNTFTFYPEVAARVMHQPVPASMPYNPAFMPGYAPVPNNVSTNPTMGAGIAAPYSGMPTGYENVMYPTIYHRGVVINRLTHNEMCNIVFKYFITQEWDHLQEDELTATATAWVTNLMYAARNYVCTFGIRASSDIRLRSVFWCSGNESIALLVKDELSTGVCELTFASVTRRMYPTSLEERIPHLANLILEQLSAAQFFEIYRPAAIATTPTLYSDSFLRATDGCVEAAYAEPPDATDE